MFIKTNYKVINTKMSKRQPTPRRQRRKWTQKTEEKIVKEEPPAPTNPSVATVSTLPRRSTQR